MTRDGAVSVNLVTGETTYASDRTPEQDHSASGDTAGAAGKVVDRAELHREQAAAKRSAGNSAEPIGRARRRQAAHPRLQFPRQTGRCRNCKGPFASRIRRRTGWMPPGTQSPIRVRESPTSIRCPAPSRRRAPPSTARSGRWNRKIPASSRATWGNAVGEGCGLRKPPCPELAGGTQAEAWRDAAKAEQAAVKANADFYYRKAVAENPQLASNPVSRLWQKRKLQKQYAAAYRAAGKNCPRPGKQRRPRQRQPRKPPRSPSAPSFL